MGSTFTAVMCPDEKVSTNPPYLSQSANRKKLRFFGNAVRRISGTHPEEGAQANAHQKGDGLRRKPENRGGTISADKQPTKKLWKNEASGSFFRQSIGLVAAARSGGCGNPKGTD